MKILNDYKWLCSEFRIQQAISGVSYDKISETRLLGGFMSILVGAHLLNNKRDNSITLNGKVQYGMSGATNGLVNYVGGDKKQ